MIPPIYNIHKTYAENVQDGPSFSGSIPPREPSTERFDFLGHKVRSLVGIPAGPLLTAEWIALAAALGFDIPTYKTIRSSSYPSHKLPNVTFVNGEGKVVPIPQALSQITITNSFGMPSKSPEFLMEDIERANNCLSDGQVMIVSVVGTPNPHTTFAHDFVKSAQLAVNAGAKIIEANFSCPNVDKADGILYMNEEAVFAFTTKIARAIHPIPLILKVGVFSNPQQMQTTFLAAARGGAKAICGINSVSMTVTPPLDETRKTSGVCGAAIRPQALDFIRNASTIIKANKLDLTLLGCGGIMLPEHFDEFFEAGAYVAMSATGMMWDPQLAMRYHERTHARP